MRNLVLVFLVFISLTAIGQSAERTMVKFSPDSTLKAVQYDTIKYDNQGNHYYLSTHIELFEPVEGGWNTDIRTLNLIHKKIPNFNGENQFHILTVFFSPDGKKLFFASRIYAYLYDIEKDTVRQLLKDRTNVALRTKMEGDMLIFSETKRIGMEYDLVKGKDFKVNCNLQ